MAQKITKKINDWFNILKVLDEVSQIPLQVVPSYRLSKNLVAIQKAVEPAEKKRTDLIKQHGNVDPRTARYTIRDDAQEVFKADVEALFKEELDVEIDTIDIQSLSDIKMKPIYFAVAADIFTDSTQSASVQAPAPAADDAPPPAAPVTPPPPAPRSKKAHPTN